MRPGWGSSPLTRGKPTSQISREHTWGLIPAHAGKTPILRRRYTCHRAHPRSRGENLVSGTQARGVRGSSPLTRGKPTSQISREHTWGLIPAHAGKTQFVAALLTIGWAHPRSRGENAISSSQASQGRGSSPLTRGKHGHGLKLVRHAGLIPAHAGKTLPDLRFYRADRSDLGKP